MTGAIVKASKQLKDSITIVGLHLNAIERAREIYQAQIKRAEHEYFERIKRATAIVAGTEEEPAIKTMTNSEATSQPAAE